MVNAPLIVMTGLMLFSWNRKNPETEYGRENFASSKTIFSGHNNARQTSASRGLNLNLDGESSLKSLMARGGNL